MVSWGNATKCGFFGNVTGFAHLQETHQERVYSSLAPEEFSTCYTVWPQYE